MKRSLVLSLSPALFLLASSVFAASPFDEILTRTLDVYCGGGVKVSYTGTYFKNEGGWSASGVNGTATGAQIFGAAAGQNGATVAQTFDSVPLAGDTYLVDAISDGYVSKPYLAAANGTVLADLEITFHPSQCSDSNHYTTSFVASCKGYVMIGGQKVSADLADAMGSTNWSYATQQTSGGDLVRGASTERTLSGVLAKTKNLSDFSHLGADHCDPVSR